MGRVNGNLNLSRALGDLVYKQDTTLPPEKQIVSAVPDVLGIYREYERDEFLVRTNKTEKKKRKRDSRLSLPSLVPGPCRYVWYVHG